MTISQILLPRAVLFAVCILLLFSLFISCGNDDASSAGVAPSTGSPQAGLGQVHEEDDDSPDDDSTAPARPLIELTPGGIQVPLPSFYFTRPDAAAETGILLDMEKELPEAAARALEGGALSDLARTLPLLDGFSLLGPIVIPFSAPLNLPAWTKDDLGLWLAPGKGVARLYDITQQPPRAIGLWCSFIRGQNVLVLRPGSPLEAGHRIMICLVSPMIDANGNRVERPALFDQVMNHQADLPQDPLVEDMIELGALLESGKPGLNPDDVLLAFSYVTGTGRNLLLSIHQAVDELDAQSPLLPEELHLEGEQTYEGTFLSPDFRHDGAIAAVKAGDPVEVEEMVRIPFLIRVPETIDGPLSPVIYLHGLSCSRYFAPIMDKLAFFAMDTLDHEDRQEDYSSGPWPFIDLINLGYFRDNIRQTVADQMALAKMIAHLAEAPEAYGLPENFLARETLSVLGHSLGCINGSIFSAADPAVDSFACVGGGGYLSIYRKLRLYDVAPLNGLHGLAPDESLILDQWVQSMMDGADGAAAAPWLILEPPEGRDPRNVLVIEAVGDQTMPNIVTEALGWSAGLPLADNQKSNWFEQPLESVPASGNMEGGTATGLLYQFEFSSPPVDRHGSLFYSTDQIRQVQTFLTTAADTGVALIIDPEASE